MVMIPITCTHRDRGRQAGNHSMSDQTGSRKPVDAPGAMAAAAKPYKYLHIGMMVGGKL